MIMAAVVAALAAACASDDSGDAANTVDGLPVNEESPGADTEPIPTEPDEGIGDGAGPLPVVSDELVAEVESAVRDLSQRLGDDARGHIQVGAGDDDLPGHAPLLQHVLRAAQPVVEGGDPLVVERHEDATAVGQERGRALGKQASRVV